MRFGSVEKGDWDPPIKNIGGAGEVIGFFGVRAGSFCRVIIAGGKWGENGAVCGGARVMDLVPFVRICGGVERSYEARIEAGRTGN